MKPINPPLTAQAAMPIRTPERLVQGSESYNSASTDDLAFCYRYDLRVGRNGDAPRVYAQTPPCRASASTMSAPAADIGAIVRMEILEFFDDGGEAQSLEHGRRSNVFKESLPTTVGKAGA